MEVIRIENISKKYRLGYVGMKTLADDLTKVYAKIRGREDPTKRIGDENIIDKRGGKYVWALKDVSLNVKQGEVIGIIGKNGAGKSTLLKILSKVTAPTSGTIKINGRVSSLLEVGTGFHPELTGKENIFLNGAILGMTKEEIRAKFDEIVDFSGVGKYIDTPVKRYSSGMFVRLAFAVAAHLEPEILIIDEVLAVGDAEFQRKALGKMQDVSRNQGRTILFVSHNMAAVQNLCNRCILVKDGCFIADGQTDKIIEKYYLDNLHIVKTDIDKRKDRTGNKAVKIKDLYLLNEQKEKVTSVKCGEKVIFAIELENNNLPNLKNVTIALGIDNYLDNRVIHLSNEMLAKEIQAFQYKTTIFFSISKLILVPGDYYITFFCTANGEIADWLQKAQKFSVMEGDYYNTGKTVTPSMGFVFSDYEFFQDVKELNS